MNIQNNLESNKGLIPEGDYCAIATAVIGVGTMKDSNYLTKSLFIGLTILDLSNKGIGVVYNLYTADLSSNSKLRKHLESWRGRVFTTQEANSFEMNVILGKSLKLTVIHQTSRAGRTYAIADNFRNHPLDEKIRNAHETFMMELDDKFNFEIFNKLPSNVQYFIRNSKEYSEIQKNQQHNHVEVDIEDVPF